MERDVGLFAGIDSQSELDVVYFGLFDNCNAHCNMCDCWSLPRSRLGLDHYQKVLTAVLSLQPAAIRFTGGEPLLFRHLPELVRQAADAGVRVSVISNGLLLPKKVSNLAKAGCVEIVLSLDAIGQHHNSIRATRGLFEHCLTGIEAIQDAGLSYGVNTVLQAQSIDDLSALAELLLTHPHPPRWWHLIPVRGNDELAPQQIQIERMRRVLPEIRQRLLSRDIMLIADENSFAEGGPSPCNVPTFTAYVRADTGNVYGCNMLVYASEPLGNVLDTPPTILWSNNAARKLRTLCLQGQNSSCARCDPSSRAMNHALRQFSRNTSIQQKVLL